MRYEADTTAFFGVVSLKKASENDYVSEASLPVELISRHHGVQYILEARASSKVFVDIFHIAEE